ncbi:MAG: hypothetical protein N4A47_00085 [Clostridia bacterium]|jgi:hypothetical protein|nr:hypothetical protein [Clostridia bacterium]
MDIRKAAKIVDYYINLFSGAEVKSNFLLIENELDYTKDNIINAHKVLFANGIVFNYMDKKDFDKHLKLLDKIDFIVDEDTSKKYNKLHKRYLKKGLFVKKLSAEELKDYSEFCKTIINMKNREIVLDIIDSISSYIKEGNHLEIDKAINHIYENILEAESYSIDEFISFGMEMEEKLSR